MPNSKQAEKRLRQDVRRRQRNKARSTAMKTQVKKFQAAADANDVAKAREELKRAMSLIDRAAKANVIHKNTASRKKAQLSKLVLALEKKG